MAIARQAKERFEELNQILPPDMEIATGDEPIVKAVNQMVADAADAGASDIHISPCEREVQLRNRVDGRLREI